MKINTQQLELLMGLRGLTHLETAERAGIWPQSLSTIKRRGTCTAETLIKIAKALGVDPIEIIEQGVNWKYDTARH